MAEHLHSIGFGGGCHWCTEAVFLSLVGVREVAQGFIAANGMHSHFSEGVIVRFEPGKIDLKDLIRVHLLTHQSASDHSMRYKYRSAVYTFSKEQSLRAERILKVLRAITERSLVTRVYDFREFKPSAPEFSNYYYKDPQKPFCKVHIKPKLNTVQKEFPHLVMGKASL